VGCKSEEQDLVAAKSVFSDRRTTMLALELNSVKELLGRVRQSGRGQSPYGIDASYSTGRARSRPIAHESRR
jgi:hypothetical protein